MRRTGGGEIGHKYVRLEAATGRKAARRPRRWRGLEEKRSGRDREVVAIATDSMGGDGERETGADFFPPGSGWEGRQM